jgi:hypothetical protein
MNTNISIKPNILTESVATISLKIRPREQEGDFKVEQDEQDGNQVIAHIELHSRILERDEAAFEGGKLFAVRAIRRHQPAEQDGGTAETQANQDENEDREVVIQHFGGAATFTRCCYRPPAMPCKKTDARLLLLHSILKLVPTARLELAQLSPLPPQDSVSTNFTTSAFALLRERRALYRTPLTHSCAATKKSMALEA